MNQILRVVRCLLVVVLGPLTLLGQSTANATGYRDESFQYPQFPVPTTAASWESQKAQVRQILRECFGALPPRHLDSVQLLRREMRATYTIEYFTFFNGLDAWVPGIILLPRNRLRRAPAILYQHYHGGEYQHGKDELFKPNWVDSLGPGEVLVQQGYVVMAIDTYAFGERSGRGPNGPSETGKNEELTWARLNLLKGRSFWGTMVRDDQLALDYLCQRPEVDPQRVGTVGMSMGCLRAFWLAALDERIKATAAVSCLVHNQTLIEMGRLGAHGIYYYVWDLLRHFDNEVILACIAPRPLLTLSGEADRLAPLAGVKIINGFLAQVYGLYGHEAPFFHHEYPGVGHAYTPAMWQTTLEFFAQWL